MASPWSIFESLLVRQDGCCAICRKPWRDCVPAKRVRDAGIFLNHLCVDHDHKTGAVRGLRCNSCNTAIGLFENKRERLASAFHYLKDPDNRADVAL
ncbi:MAG: hypothetical protein JOZ24_02170 [Candidatus Eremiobacteraeota bacterium]|nr:hypothetical protein [Candidatus Eremiobacteraeota bacterium]